MSRQKAVFFDVDGTLWDRKEFIPPSTIQAIHRLQAAGNLAFICTGRTRSFFQDERLLSLGFDGIVSGCGTMIEYDDTVPFYLTMPNDILADTIKTLRKYRIIPVLEGRYDCYMDAEELGNPELVQIFRRDTKGHLREIQDCWGSWEASKLTVMTEGCTQQEMEQMMEELGHIYDFKIHHIGIAELVPKGFHKGSGIQKVCDLLGMQIGDTIAVGDGPNDIDMLRMAGVGVVMGDGAEEAKAVADYITAPLHEAGIWKACEHLGLFEQESLKSY